MQHFLSPNLKKIDGSSRYSTWSHMSHAARAAAHRKAKNGAGISPSRNVALRPQKLRLTSGTLNQISKDQQDDEFSSSLPPENTWLLENKLIATLLNG